MNNISIEPKSYDSNRTLPEDNTSRFFITGGSGFIGSHLTDRLIAQGHQVTVYDSLVSSTKDNIQHHIGNERFTFIESDLKDFPSLKTAMEGHDVIWHLGANTGIVQGNTITDLDLNNCTIGTYNVLEAMRQNGISNLIFTSTSAIYGEIKTFPTAESDGPILPISLYGAGKLAGEGLVSAYCHLFGLQACMFRFGNVVGNRMNHGVIYDFIHKLKSNPKELEILGDGTQNKNYFLVEDCIDGMLCAYYNSTKRCDVFNLGSETTVTVKEIANIVTEEMGLKNVTFQYTGTERGWPGDVTTVRFSLQKIMSLGWEPKHSSAEAVRKAAQRILKTEFA